MILAGVNKRANVAFGHAFICAAAKNVPVFMGKNRGDFRCIAVNVFNPLRVDIGEFVRKKSKCGMAALSLAKRGSPLFFRNDKNGPFRITDIDRKQRVCDGLPRIRKWFIGIDVWPSHDWDGQQHPDT